MIMTGAILIILASVFWGFSGLTFRRMCERGPDITWQSLPISSIKCKFIDKIEPILTVITILSIVVLIVGSILIGKGTNLWVGIVSFIIGTLLNEFLWKPILSKIEILDFWDNSQKVSREPRQEMINELVEQSSIDIGGKPVKPGTLESRANEFSKADLDQFLNTYGTPYQRREFENFAGRVEMAKTGYFGGRQKTEEFLVQGMLAERILKDLDAATNALKLRTEDEVKPEKPNHADKNNAITLKKNEGNQTIENRPNITQIIEQADHGNAKAQYNLGILHSLGDGFPQSYEEAAKWFGKAANQGDIDAQYNLGKLYEEGNGVSQSYEEAAIWYEKAANQGDAGSQYNLGVFYEKGHGVKQSYEEAIRWFQKAADQEDADALFGLGTFYENGLGVPKNLEKAEKYYHSAAIKGHATAQYNLGVLNFKKGDDSGYMKAAKWFGASATQGLADAQRNLGLLHYKGLGVTESRTKARKWFQKAAEQGDEKAEAILNSF